MVAATGMSAASGGANAQPVSNDTATRLAAEARVNGRLDAPALAARLSALGGGTTLTAQVEAQLTVVERGELARAMDAANDNPAPPPGTGTGTGAPDPVQLGLDLGQMALDITGIVDPTPISDGLNAAISVGRSIGSVFSGEWGDAGGHLANAGISAAGIAVGVGDLAKLGKVGKWAETVSDSVAAIAHNPALRSTLEPALRKVKDAIDAIPPGALDKLPQSARESIEATKRQLGDFFGGATQATSRAGLHSAKVGANTAEWTLDASGHPTKVTATLSELQPTGTARGPAELSAQDKTRTRGLPDDDAGHVIGHRFLGDQGARNMFPQNFNFNRSAYKTMENEWAAWIEKGGTVKVDVELIGGSAGRPAEVGVVYRVYNEAGQRVFRNAETFANEAGQTFNRVPTSDMNRMLGN